MGLRECGEGSRNNQFLFSGFKAVESGEEIFQYSVEEIIKAKSEANVEQVVIVGYGGKILYNFRYVRCYVYMTVILIRAL
jgi:hypothetical protein